MRKFFKFANYFCFVAFIVIFIASVINPNYFAEKSKIIIPAFSLSFVYLSYLLIKMTNKMKD